MNREQLEHVIRAAADITDDEIVVVGSQAILGQFPDAPGALLVSLEADVYPRSHPERADEIDGAIGDGSAFHEAFGYYAHGVGPETPIAPAGWQDRLVRISVPLRRGGVAIGWCLEAHDLVLAKIAAGREHDLAFASAALQHGLVRPEELRARLASMPPSHLSEARKRLDGLLMKRS